MNKIEKFKSNRKGGRKITSLRDGVKLSIVRKPCVSLFGSVQVHVEVPLNGDSFNYYFSISDRCSEKIVRLIEKDRPAVNAGLWARISER